LLVSSSKPKLAFISPLFLFPNDAGGKIRTTNILRGMKGGAFDIVLVMPATNDELRDWMPEIESICDELIAWQPAPPRPKWRRALDMLGRLPVNIVSDRTHAALSSVATVATRPDVDLLVFDFVHSAVMRPACMACPAVCFTHNVEAEIFARHAARASSAVWRRIWAAQYAKMKRYEGTALRAFDTVIAVSERDVLAFQNEYSVSSARAIPTGVDLEFFAYQRPPAIDATYPPTVVFTGSMDWAANIDGVQFFLKEVWPRVLAALPDARFIVVGRNPPFGLQALARGSKQVEFTGFVDDVRPYVHAAHAFVIPLLVGGGTRIKAFEAMAMGCPVISTSIGIEGLDARENIDYLQRDDAASMGMTIVDLLKNEALRQRLSLNARQLVEQKFSHKVVANEFEQICLDSLSKGVKQHGTETAPKSVSLRSNRYAA
jgi:glycosyltransferase involved in cell wall biosynthesis